MDNNSTEKTLTEIRTEAGAQCSSAELRKSTVLTVEDDRLGVTPGLRVRPIGKSEPKGLIPRTLSELFTAQSIKTAGTYVTRKKSGDAGIDGESRDDWRKRLETPEAVEKFANTVISGTYRFSPMRLIDSPKPDGTMRTICVPTYRDRTVLRILAQEIARVLEPKLPDSVVGFRTGKGTTEALKHAADTIRATGHLTVMKVDFKKYFDRINRDRLMGYLEELLGSSEILGLVRFSLAVERQRGLEKVKTTTVGIPQGSPVSPVLANLYALKEFDYRLQRKGIPHARYADDAIIFVKPEKKEETMDTIREAVQALGLQLNETKTKVVDLDAGECFEFLGIEGTKDGFRYSDKRITKVADRLGRHKSGRGPKNSRTATVTISDDLAELRTLVTQQLSFVRLAPADPKEMKAKIHALKLQVLDLLRAPMVLASKPAIAARPKGAA